VLGLTGPGTSCSPAPLSQLTYTRATPFWASETLGSQELRSATVN
jgi:hypothetical protein